MGGREGGTEGEPSGGRERVGRGRGQACQDQQRVSLRVMGGCRAPLWPQCTNLRSCLASRGTSQRRPRRRWDEAVWELTRRCAQVSCPNEATQRTDRPLSGSPVLSSCAEGREGEGRRAEGKKG